MRRHLLSLALIAAVAAPLRSQDRDAAALHLLMNGLTVTARVLIIGVHPDDEDSQLIAWLSRGRGVETAYLSLTRGEAGQNFSGAETGGVLGAVRTQELLAARRIDGAALFFARAYDFGPSKNADDTFRHWPHQEILGDIVTVIRSFRPHVIVAIYPDTLPDGEGQQQAMAMLAREAFDAAGDTAAYPATTTYGHAWVPLKLYRRGAGLTIDAGEYDGVLGRSYADIAVESRTQHRSQGFIGAAGAALRRLPRVQLLRAATRVNDSMPPSSERSIFDGIDTSVTRLIPGPFSGDVERVLPSIIALADSARGSLDLARPGGVVRYLARATRLVTIARAGAAYCQHPSLDAPVAMMATAPCDGHALDLDASLDVMQRRFTAALLLASGVSFELTADRELMADVDTVPVTVTMYNRGTTPVTLADLVVSGARHTAMTPIVVPPDSAVREVRLVTDLPNSRPWWIDKRFADLYPSTVSSIDGLDRGKLVPNPLVGRAQEPRQISMVVTAAGVYSVPGIAIPETIRRESDVRATVTVGGATVTTSLGPVLYQYADPAVGAQGRPVSGVPAVTLSFGGALEWMTAHKPITRPIRLAITSFSDREQSFKLNFVAPKGMRLDSVPSSLTLAPHERRDLFLHVRGMLDTGRHIFGAIGNARNARYTTGFQTVQYPHIPPIHVFRNSALYLQAVDMVVPAGLTVLYVQGVGDDIVPALKQVGVSVAVVTADDFPGVDLAQVSTVVIGQRAYDAFPQLVDQTARLMEFARKGGTVLVLQHTSMPSGVLPYPRSLANVPPVTASPPAAPMFESVAPDALVTVIDPKARLLNWPNVIRADDWSEWVRDRALYVPTTADPHYSTVVEMLDRVKNQNRNTVLVAPVGKGAYVYTTLSFGEQIPAGVPGALRLFVNLLSAGLPRDGRSGGLSAP